MANSITVPAGFDIRLCISPPHSFVIVAPSGVKAELGALRRPGAVSALFTHDRGVTWPDRRGCSAATAHLAAGNLVGLQFESVADALACHRRLMTERSHAAAP